MEKEVKNIIKMKGITSLPLFTEKLNGSGRYVMEFDFNWIIPMPSSLKLKSGKVEDLAIETAFRRDAVLRYRFGRNRTPMPEKVYIEELAMYDKSVDKLVELGYQYLKNLELYGSTTSCDWCRKNWGTKQNAYGSKSPDANTVIFSTDCTAPEKAIARLAKMYPESEIEHWWSDEDMSCNTGYAKYNGGEASEVIHHDDCSHKAYETYVLCWGESTCLYQDKDRLWKRRNCYECFGCG